MPFVKRTVEPVDLSNRPLPNDGLSEIETVTVRVCNNTLCGLVMQLANLAHQANSIFDEVLLEGNKLAERTADLTVRVVKLEENVSKLDARAVKVPVSNLDSFKVITEHFRTPQLCQKELFHPSSRPPCILSVYEKACTNLKAVRDKLKEYHEDEVTLYSVRASSLLENQGKAQYDYEIYFPQDLDQLPSPHEQKPERISQPRKVQRTQSARNVPWESGRHHRSHLPTPEQLVRLSAPSSSYVSVDISGDNFKRLSLVRRSLTLQSLELAQRRRQKHGRHEWRSTIAGIPNAVDMDFEQGSSQGSTVSTSALSEELRTQSLDRRMLKNKKRSYLSKRGVSILSSLRLKKSSKLVLHPSEPIDPHTLKQLEEIPVSNWTGSLPRNVRLNTDRTRNGSVPRGRIMNRWSGDYSTSDGSSNNSIEHNLPNGSIHHSGIASLGRGTRNRGLRLQQSTVPEGIICTKPHTLSITHLDSAHTQETHVRTGQPSVVTLRNRKPFQPKEERRSSSGNWSGTDSNRTSLNSDSEIVQILSQNTNGNQDGSPSDSAVSLSNEGEPVTPMGQNTYFLSKNFGQYPGVHPRPNELCLEGGTLRRSDSESSGTPTPTNEEAMSQLTADKWLQSVSPPPVITPRPEAGNMAPASKTPNPAHYQPTFSDSSSESSEHPSLSALSDHSSIDLDLCLADAVEEFNDSDSVSTSHSVDQEGYWTSMHFDCGFPYRKPSLSRLENRIPANQPSTSQKVETTGLALDLAPPPPKRVDSITSATEVGQPGSVEKAESVVSTSSSSSLTPTNISDDNLSITASLTDNASDISESSYTLPEPMQSPTHPKMYTLFFNEGRSSEGKVSTFDSQNLRKGKTPPPNNQQQNIFFGMFPSASSMNLPPRMSQKEEEDGPLSPGGTPRSPLGLYPDNYNTMKRKTNIKQVGPKGDGLLHHDVVRVAPPSTSSVVPPPSNGSQKFIFTGKTTPNVTNSSSLNQGDMKVNAMSHEERAEILQMLRNSRNSGSSLNSGPKSPNMLMLQVDKGQVSFRETYKENVQGGKLDPDKAIIEAAKQMEEMRKDKEPLESSSDMLERPSSLPLEEESSSESDDFDSSPNKTPVEIYPYIDYKFDPTLKPKSSILKKVKDIKKDDTKELMAKIEASKRKIDIDPFEEVLSPPKEVTPPSTLPARRISFSKYVHIDNKPVKMCHMSGRPVTRRDGFVALESELGMSSISQVSSSLQNVTGDVKGPTSAELLYRGSVLNDKAAPIATTDEDYEDEDDEIITPEEEKQFKVVTVTAIKDVEEPPKNTVEVISISSSQNEPGPEVDGKASNSKKSEEVKVGKVTKEQNPTKPDELDALLAELVQFTKENEELMGREVSESNETQEGKTEGSVDKEGNSTEHSVDETRRTNDASSGKASDQEQLEALFQSLKLNNNENEVPLDNSVSS